MTTYLFIDRSSSACGNCKGSNVDPFSEKHDQNYSPFTTPNDAPVCGETYTHVSSHYTGMDDAVKEMRPDLPFISPYYGAQFDES